MSPNLYQRTTERHRQWLHQRPLELLRGELVESCLRSNQTCSVSPITRQLCLIPPHKIRRLIFGDGETEGVQTRDTRTIEDHTLEVDVYMLNVEIPVFLNHLTHRLLSARHQTSLKNPSLRNLASPREKILTLGTLQWNCPDRSVYGRNYSQPSKLHRTFTQFSLSICLDLSSQQRVSGF